MNKKYYEKSMSNIQQLLDPWGYTFLKYEATSEKHLTKLQNSTLNSTYHKFFYIIAKVSLTHVSLITLNRLDPLVEKQEGIFQKKIRQFFFNSKLYISNVLFFKY